MGYKTYSLSETENKSSDKPVVTGDGYMENQFFSALLDMNTGGLASLKLKENGCELVPEGEQINALLLQNEDPKGGMSSWFLQPVGDPWVQKAESVELVEQGAVRCVYRSTYKYQDSAFTRDLVFYPDLPRLDVQMTADWHEHDLWVRAMFRTTLENGKAFFNVPCVMERS